MFQYLCAQVLTKASRCSVFPMYKQRFFSVCLPELLDKYKHASEDRKANYLLVSHSICFQVFLVKELCIVATLL